jgi:putative transposase
VRAVYKRGEWRIQFVCTHEPAAEPPGEETAGVDLGIVNVAAVSYSTGDTELYPGHALREDEYYLQKELAKCTDSTSRRATRLQETRSGRRAHYLHTITTDIIDTCVDRGVGELFVGDLHGIRDEDDPETDQRVAVDWGPQGNLDLHSWPFAKIVTMLKYKGALEGITVTEVDERDTSRTCSVCGTASDAQRVQRGLYRCRDCETVANSDVAGAENIRLVGLDRFPRTSDSIPVDRSTGCLAQPVVNLFRRGEHVPSSGQGTLVQPASIG